MPIFRRSRDKDDDLRPDQVISSGRGKLPIDGLTWFGLILALLGWLLLIVSMFLGQVLAHNGSLVADLQLRSNVVTVAQSGILSGFGLAVIGVLRAGFGALNRFFDAVLQRSSAPKAAAPMADDDFDRPEPVVVVPKSGSPERFGTPGRHKDRNYVILPDGSVEVETLLGTRVFATMEEARDFIH